MPGVCRSVPYRARLTAVARRTLGADARALITSLRDRRERRRQGRYRAAGKPSLVAPINLVRFVWLIAADAACYSSAESPEYNVGGRAVIPRWKNRAGRASDARPTRRPRRVAPP